MADASDTTFDSGRIVAVRGGIVDVVFAVGGPDIDELLFAGETPLQVMTFVEGVLRAALRWPLCRAWGLAPLCAQPAGR